MHQACATRVVVQPNLEMDLATPIHDNTYAGKRTSIQSAAFAVGIVFLLVGILGFVPGITSQYDQMRLAGHESGAMLMGMFQVSILHNLVHLLFGVWGVLAAKSVSGSLFYARAVAVSYGLLMVMGLITAGNLHTTFGLVPLYGHDVWLHALLAGVAAYFGFMRGTDRDLATAR